MARQDRITLPQETLLGIIDSYAEMQELFVRAELRGRLWVLECSEDPERSDRMPRDSDIYELHRQMFSPLFAWAGIPRREPRGPGGVEHVPWFEVRAQLRNRFENLQAQLEAEAEEASGKLAGATLATLVAQAHHDFQFVHPFADTNGRTGRILDHYLLWVTFGLGGTGVEDSPVIDYFPDELHEDLYYEGLAEADAGYDAKLTSYYTERIEAALVVLEEKSE